jgi:hypothetical protein
MAERTLSILHLLSYPWFTGPAEPVLALARAQQGRGHRVVFACDTQRPGDLAAKAEEQRIPVERRLALCSRSGPILLLRDILTLKRLWREGEFDILHCHRSHDHSLAALARPRPPRRPPRPPRPPPPTPGRNTGGKRPPAPPPPAVG